MSWWQVALVAVIAASLCHLVMVGASTLCDRIAPLEGAPPEGPVPFIVVPLFFGLVAAVVAQRSGALLEIVAALALLAVLAASWTSDARRGLILDAFTLPGMAVMGMLCLCLHEIHPLIAGGVVGVVLGVVAFTSKGRGLGWGDVKLAALGTSVVGLPIGVVTLCVACVAVSGYALVIRRSKEPVAFAPFLSVCYALAIAFPNPGVL